MQAESHIGQSEKNKCSFVQLHLFCLCVASDGLAVAPPELTSCTLVHEHENVRGAAARAALCDGVTSIDRQAGAEARTSRGRGAAARDHHQAILSTQLSWWAARHGACDDDDEFGEPTRVVGPAETTLASDAIAGSSSNSNSSTSCSSETELASTAA